MTTTLAATTADGSQANAGGLISPNARVLSYDGRYVVFQSSATDLVATDTTNTQDIFRKDLSTGEVVQVSYTADTQPNGSNSNASISADGRYVVFQSFATNLVAGPDGNASGTDIFRKDLNTGALVRVSETAAGVTGTSASASAAISANGRYVAFQSTSTNFASNDTNNTFDVFRKDLDTGAIVRVSESATGTPAAGGGSSLASISGDGRYVVFTSAATNLAGTDTNNAFDIFRKDLDTGAIVRVSDAQGGGQSNGASVNASVSADGRYVVFQSTATNLVAGGDANGTGADIFRKDLTTGTIVRVTETVGGIQANSASTFSSVSDDGRYVTFQSAATNLVAGDGNGTTDIFLKDMQTGEIVRISNAAGTTTAADGASNFPSISGDGSRIAFNSQAANLVGNDGNGQQDVFVTDNPVCFAQGSAIRVVREGAVRDVAVEALTVGDLAVTASGAHRPIRWIGHRTVACRGRSPLLPVRIAVGAFGEGRPARALVVSAAHAICVDVLGEVLIPADRLINGTTITQEDVESVTYWHVELDSHDILLAEGLPAESYLDCGNRRFFANADATDLLAAPDARPEDALPFCRPFHEAGPVVELVRARLQERAEELGWRRIEEQCGGMHLVADGQTIRPDVAGLTARFVLPAEARDVRLVSAVNIPAHVMPGTTAARRRGLPIAGLTIDDGLTGPRTVALDDPRLGDGFHAFETGMRWTDGAAVMPAELWAGCRGTVFLCVRLAGQASPRWVGPDEAAHARDAREARRA